MSDNLNSELKRTNKTNTAPSADAEIKINQSMITLAFKQNKYSLIAALAIAALLVYELSNSFPAEHLWIWSCAFVLVTLVRVVFVLIFEKITLTKQNSAMWRNIFITCTLFAGIMWGILAAIFLPTQFGIQQTLVILMLGGVCAGSVPYLASVLPASLGFLCCCLLPLIFNMYFFQKNISLEFVLATSFYLIYLIVISIRTNKMLYQSFSLQYENHSLLEHLSKAKFELELINQKLEQAATHDPLTNVGNRNLFVTNLSQSIDRAKKSKTLFSLFYIDLDNFKTINDTHGHHIGDRLLLVLVDRLEDVFRNTDSIFRLGGDEFAVIVENMQYPKDVSKLAIRICQALATPVYINDLDIRVSASIGISVFPLDGEDSESLINVADKAMYHVKDKGGNDFRFNVDSL
ncbi:MAG: diguanylate cyclase [Gammaproteobacteria bacterium]|nr:diguanylate cyclase [Gammaproteobacteria bacterium]